MPKQEDAVVAICQTCTDAEEAINELRKSGFDLTKLCSVGKDYDTGEYVSEALQILAAR